MADPSLQNRTADVPGSDVRPRTKVSALLGDPVLYQHVEVAPGDLMIVAPDHEIYARYFGVNHYATTFIEPDELLRFSKASNSEQRTLRRGCACRKLNPAILVMQSAQDWATKNAPGAIDGARDRCIFLQG